MLSRLFSIILSILLFVSCAPKGATESGNTVSKIEMYLSAFGVESDRYPNIEAMIDFEKGTSLCKVSYSTLIINLFSMT